jgi:hypothetical protein
MKLGTICTEVLSFTDEAGVIPLSCKVECAKDAALDKSLIQGVSTWTWYQVQFVPTSDLIREQSSGAFT